MEATGRYHEPVAAALHEYGIYVCVLNTCSDEWVVKHISENPYLQYFIGMKEYGSSCPFGASTMVAFRKRFSPEDIAEILEATIPKPDDAGNAL